MNSTNLVVRAVCELLADKVSGGYSLHVNNQEIPLFLNKDGATKYPQIRLSPFIEKGDVDYQRFIESGYAKYRHYQYGIFQVDIYAKHLSLAQDTYDVLTARLFDYFNLEIVEHNNNHYNEQIDDNIYRNKSFAIMDDGLFKDIYTVRIEDTYFKRVPRREELIMDSFFVSPDYLYFKTNKNVKKMKIAPLMQGRLFSNGFSCIDNGVISYSLSKQRNLSSLEDNEVERISFDMSVLFNKILNREELPQVQSIKFRKANVK